MPVHMQPVHTQTTVQANGKLLPNRHVSCLTGTQARTVMHNQAVFGNQATKTCYLEHCTSHTPCLLQGWYERRPPCTFKQIIDTQFVAAMGPPGGGRNPITNRLLRHFNMLTMTDMSDDSCRRIFTTILGSFVSKHFNEKVVRSAPSCKCCCLGCPLHVC